MDRHDANRHVAGLRPRPLPTGGRHAGGEGRRVLRSEVRAIGDYNFEWMGD